MNSNHHQIIDALVASQSALRQMSGQEKSAALNHIAQTILDEQQSLAQLIVKEAKKPLKYAMGEVSRAAQTFWIAAEEAKRNSGEYLSLDWTLASKGKEGIVKRFPIGPVLGITPFNFPLNLVAHKVAPALAAGCSILIKPSPKTPQTAQRLIEICKSSGFPEQAIALLELPNEQVLDLVEDHRFKMLSFTGSPEIGWMLKSKAGKKKVALELGGNASCIITPSADLQKAVDRCIVGGFAYSGQVCIHTQIIYLHERIFEDFKTRFLTQLNTLQIGDITLPDTDFGAMISVEAAQRVETWILAAQEQGACLLAGGSRTDGVLEPTVLMNVPTTCKVWKEEIFGPVVVLRPYTEFDAALKSINESRFGLQTGLFTDRHSEIQQAFNTLEVGGLMINDVPTFRVDHMPYGGVKDSGFGREGVRYAMEEMTEPRLLVYNKVD